MKKLFLWIKTQEGATVPGVVPAPNVLARTLVPDQDATVVAVVQTIADVIVVNV
jgi:hypothetical protein